MKRLVKKALRPAVERTRRLIRESVAESVPKPIAIDQEAQSQQIQRSICTQYASFKLAGKAPYPRIGDAGFRVYSQFEEDGIILYVLSMIGFKTKRVVEMSCGNGHECMAANLILNHGFDGYLFDGSTDNIQRAEAFFKSKRDCLLYPPVLTAAWITAENVNELLSKSGCAGEVDLFSLDVDGNDYWIWKAVDAISPRLLVIESHNVIPSDRSLAIEYRPDFSYLDAAGPAQMYLGASLLAMAKLCKQKGYRMIGAHRHGFNVFFLRDDEGKQFFPEVSIQEVHDNHWTRWNQATNWPLVKDMHWKEV
jgi:hypothetical protein